MSVGVGHSLQARSLSSDVVPYSTMVGQNDLSLLALKQQSYNWAIVDFERKGAFPNYRFFFFLSINRLDCGGYPSYSKSRVNLVGNTRFVVFENLDTYPSYRDI